jgi:hypothetical protein
MYLILLHLLPWLKRFLVAQMTNYNISSCPQCSPEFWGLAPWLQAITRTTRVHRISPLCACQLNGLSQIAAIVNVNPHHDLWHMERQIVPTELMSGWSASGTGFFHVVRGF